MHIGNFVEIKEAVIETGAKANHLSYIGDARVGAGANVGAGTITCNYDGVAKHRTEIGKNAFIGSNSALVAPVKVGDGAYVGSGSVITQDVPADALAVARGRQVIKEGWAQRLHELKRLVKKRTKLAFQQAVVKDRTGHHCPLVHLSQFDRYLAFSFHLQGRTSRHLLPLIVAPLEGCSHVRNCRHSRA